MFSPSELNAILHAVPVPLNPLVQTTGSMRRELGAQVARCELLTAVLDMLSGGIVVIDVDRRVLFANARARRVGSIGEPARFRFADPCADEELGAVLDATKAALLCAAGRDGPAGFRLMKLPNPQSAFLLLLAASAASASSGSPDGTPPSDYVSS